MTRHTFIVLRRNFVTLSVRLALFFCLSLAVVISAAAQPATVVGSWAAPVHTGTIAIHSSLMNNGNIIFWTYSLHRGLGPTIAKILNPTTGVVADATPPFNADFYCGGITFLQDGKLFVTGGQNEDGVIRGGVTNTEIFDPTTSTWTQGPAMNYGRWYPTNLEMTDGTVLILSGFDSAGVTNVHPIELYNPTLQTITTLPATANTPALTDTYPRMHILPNGLIFNSGQRADTQMYDPVAQDWYFVSNSTFGTRQEGTSVLLPGLYKVLAAGGTLTENAAGATNTAEIIDLSQTNPQWTSTAPMTYARYNHNLVILADGTVLAVGGNTQGIYDSPVYAAELYNPTTGQWTVMASQAGSRGHHGTALLLPDGTVYSAGSDNGTQDDDSYEIYTPPYLLTGNARPVISSAPVSVNYGQTFTIGTQQAANITRVALIKPGADTHDNNMDQRYVDLTWTVGTSHLTATAPASATYAPPGYYMLVIVDNNGVPSIMPFLQVISAQAQNPVASLSSTSLNFGTQPAERASPIQTVILTNTGTANLNISSMQVTDADYLLTNLCPASLTPQAACNIQVKFKPLKKGPLTGQVTITDNAADSPQSIALSGTGTFALTSPTSLSFGTVAVGKSSTQSVTLTNLGTTAMSITKIYTSGLPYTQSNTCGTSLAAKASCTVSVTFSPTASGATTGTLYLADSGGGSPQQVGLTGTGQ